MYVVTNNKSNKTIMLLNPCNLWLASDFAGSVHELLHTRNHNELERARRLRRLLNLRQTLLAPITRRWHPQFQIRERLQSSRAEFREIVRERLDLFQRRRTIDHRAE